MVCIELLTKGACTVKKENWNELVREIGETFKARKKQFCEETKKLKEKHSARKIVNLHEKLYQQLEGLHKKIKKLEQKGTSLLREFRRDRRYSDRNDQLQNRNFFFCWPDT